MEPIQEIEESVVDGVFTVRYVGFDPNLYPGQDLEAVRQRFCEPTKDRYALTKGGALHAFLLGSGLLVGFVALVLANRLAELLDAELAPAADVLVVVLGWALPTLCALLRAFVLTARDRARALERFTLSLDREHLTITGSRSPTRTVELCDIACFEGGSDLTLVRAAGSRQALPGVVASALHATLATRLNRGLLAVRASVTGYRGDTRARVSPAASAPDGPAAPDEPDVAPDEHRRSAR